LQKTSPSSSPAASRTESPKDEAIDHLASLTAHRDREMLDVSLAQGVQELLSAGSVGVFRLQGQEGDLRRWLCCGLARRGEFTVSDPSWVDADTLPPEAAFPLRQKVLASRQICQSELPAAPADGTPLRHLTVLPLVVELGSPGVIEVHTEQAIPLPALRSIQTLLKVFANFQNLLESSQRDSLTGLLNRQSFDASFMKASMPESDRDGMPINQAERRSEQATGYWLGVIDIDHFKRVNDRFGHLIGDEVLVLLARIMRQSFRHHDRLYRFGGEEFVVFLRSGSEADTMGAFERFRHHVESYAFPQIGQVTVSVGFTEVQMHDTPNAAFSRADQGVYQAKHQGRNQVLCFEAEVRSGVLQSEDKHIGGVDLF